MLKSPVWNCANLPAGGKMQRTPETLSVEVRDHLFGHILPFWCGPAVDHDKGGWMAWLSNDLTSDRTQPKGLIVHSRILWAFSAVHQASPNPQFKAMADRAFHYLTEKFWDDRHGGAFWRLNDDGQVVDSSKKIYGQAFVIYALNEYHRAFGSPQAMQRAEGVYRLIERHAHDDQFGGYFEVCNADWSPAGSDARLSEKDLAEKKSMNNHLHVLEAYTQLYMTTRAPEPRQRLIELVRVFLDSILDPGTMHLHHFFDEQWAVRSDSYTFGHDIEASWLLCEAVEALEDPGLKKRVTEVALSMAAKVLNEALSPEGGLFYEGRAGAIIDDGRECWPQAEALVGFLNAFQISGDQKFFSAAVDVWDFIQNSLVDRVHGEWFWRIHRDGSPDPRLPKVSEWKGPYHGTRACLETIHRLHPKSSATIP